MFVLLLLLLIEGFSLCLRHPVIEVTGRCHQQILTVSLVHTLRPYGFIEDNGEEFVTHLLDGLTLVQRQPTGICLLEYLIKILSRKAWLEFLTAIVMIDAARKPDTLQIDLQSLEIIGVMRDGHVRVDHLQHLTDTEVILAKLIESDIPTI